MLFDNRFVRDLPGDRVTGGGRRQVQGALYSRVEPTPVDAPRLIACAPEVAAQLGLDPRDLGVEPWLGVLSGNAVLPGMQPWASNYGGHQFGHWAGQLGDGRAISLGETQTPVGGRLELQLKGAGRTPYSRTADGRAVMRSSIREFLCSEAMHHLGIPTTRALSLVATGEPVLRDMFYDGNPRHEPGAIVCRVAPSFVRFGHFELPASRSDHALLERLVEFTIARDFAKAEWNAGSSDNPTGREAMRAQWFAEVCRRTAVMIAHWMRVGFVHGVMNTDNMSILGLTIDYGPYGWVDNYDPGWTPNTTDAQHRRYRFAHQPQIAHWNLRCLAGALAPLFQSTAPLIEGLGVFESTYVAAERANLAAKLGLSECRDDDPAHMERLQGLLHDAEVDMTIFFRTLAEFDPHKPDLALFDDAFYEPHKRDRHAEEFTLWLSAHARRLLDDPLDPRERRDRMNRTNPRYVLRNYLAQQVIDRVEAGDDGAVAELLEVLRRPYDDQNEHAALAARRPDWARERAGCSMLSCSS